MFSNTFPSRDVISETAAKMLLEISAVHFRADQPYTFTSGLASPVYIDCRKLISYPRIRSALMDFAASIIFRDVGFEQFDAVAGGETAGIPFAAWLSDRMGLPMHGQNNVRLNPSMIPKHPEVLIRNPVAFIFQSSLQRTEDEALP